MGASPSGALPVLDGADAASGKRRDSLLREEK